MLKEFKAFVMRGNVVDLAVGVIIGAAFGRIVDSLVKDLIMPVVGRFVGGLDFSNWFLLLRPPPPGYNGPMTYELDGRQYLILPVQDVLYAFALPARSSN